jgi:hypothetical protein
VDEDGRAGQPLRVGGAGVTARRQSEAGADEGGERQGAGSAAAPRGAAGECGDERACGDDTRDAVASAEPGLPGRPPGERGQRQVEGVEPLNADRQQVANETDQSGASHDRHPVARSARHPALEKGATDAEKEADTERELRRPESEADRPVDRLRRRRIGACSADREHDRSADGMAVLGHDAPGQDMRSRSEAGGRFDLQRRVPQREPGERNGRSVGMHELQHQRRDRFVECQREVLRRGRDERALRGLRTHHRRVRHGGADRAEQDGEGEGRRGP